MPCHDIIEAGCKRDILKRPFFLCLGFPSKEMQQKNEAAGKDDDDNGGTTRDKARRHFTWRRAGEQQWHNKTNRHSADLCLSRMPAFRAQSKPIQRAGKYLFDRSELARTCDWLPRSPGLKFNNQRARKNLWHVVPFRISLVRPWMIA